MKLIIILQNIKQKFSDILEYNSWNKKQKMFITITFHKKRNFSFNISNLVSFK